VDFDRRRHFGQPAELAKVATILMLARWLATLREPPSMLRDLIIPGIIAGVPCLLVLKQPDLGSAIVFMAILFLVLFWAGTKPSLLVLAASPVIGLVLAFSPLPGASGSPYWPRCCSGGDPTSGRGSRSWGSTSSAGCWRCRSGIGSRPISKTACSPS